MSGFISDTHPLTNVQHNTVKANEKEFNMTVSYAMHMGNVRHSNVLSFSQKHQMTRSCAHEPTYS